MKKFVVLMALLVAMPLVAARPRLVSVADATEPSAPIVSYSLGMLPTGELQLSISGGMNFVPTTSLTVWDGDQKVMIVQPQTIVTRDESTGIRGELGNVSTFSVPYSAVTKRGRHILSAGVCAEKACFMQTFAIIDAQPFMLTPSVVGCGENVTLQISVGLVDYEAPESMVATFGGIVMGEAKLFAHPSPSLAIYQIAVANSNYQYLLTQGVGDLKLEGGSLPPVVAQRLHLPSSICAGGE